MRSLSLRVSAGLLIACAVLAAAAATIGGVGILGVRDANRVGDRVARDELAPPTVTARLAHDIDTAYASGQVLLLGQVAARDALVERLDDEQIPAVEADLAEVRQIHAGDDAAELAGIGQLIDE